MITVIIKDSHIKYLLCAHPFIAIYNISVSLYFKITLRGRFFKSLIYRWGNQGPEMLSKLLKITQKKGGVRI